MNIRKKIAITVSAVLLVVVVAVSVSFASQGVEIYVPASRLEEARQLLEAAPEEDSPDP